jgi:hypothetical protein
MKIRTAAVLLAVFTSVIFLAACPKRVTISEIEANPSKFQDKEVIVAGIVRDSYGVNIPGTPIKGGAYKIDDGTGSIWVFTEDAVPNKGAEIGVKGKIASGVNWKGKNYGLGMYEKDRKFGKR